MQLSRNESPIGRVTRPMSVRAYRFTLALGLLAIAHASASTAPDATGQDAPDQAVAATADRQDPSTQVQTQFAPGVLTVIPPAPDPKETFAGPQTLQSMIDAHPEISWSQTGNHPDGKPHFDPRSRTLEEMLKQVILRHEIFCLEFSFKPLRQIYLDIPRPDGKMQRKLVQYMVYRVRYRGGDLRPAADNPDEPIYKRIESVSYPSRRFFPMFILENRETDAEYIDTILPTAVQRIAIREQITAPLHNSVDISRVKIPRTQDPDAPGVWGVATWVDLDPNTDFISVNVFGLTNAFRQDGEGPDAPYRRKALMLNFYRPGDTMNPIADRVRFGVPAYDNAQEQANVLEKYGIPQRLDYLWVFR